MDNFSSYIKKKKFHITDAISYSLSLRSRLIYLTSSTVSSNIIIYSDILYNLIYNVSISA